MKTKLSRILNQKIFSGSKHSKSNRIPATTRKEFKNWKISFFIFAHLLFLANHHSIVRFESFAGHIAVTGSTLLLVTLQMAIRILFSSSHWPLLIDSTDSSHWFHSTWTVKSSLIICWRISSRQIWQHSNTEVSFESKLWEVEVKLWLLKFSTKPQFGWSSWEIAFVHTCWPTCVLKWIGKAVRKF